MEIVKAGHELEMEMGTAGHEFETEMGKTYRWKGI